MRKQGIYRIVPAGTHSGLETQADISSRRGGPASRRLVLKAMTNWLLLVDQVRPIRALVRAIDDQGD